MKNWKNIGIALLLLVANFSVSVAQRINFSTWTGSADIIITPVGKNLGELKFNDIKKVLVAGSDAVDIKLTDPAAAVYRIEAPSELEITVELSAPSVLTLPGNSPKTIPLTLNMAYSNDSPIVSTGFPNPEAAVLVSQGFNSVTFPISKRSAGGPPLPPTPEFGGVARQKSSAFVFIYGKMGPVPNDASAGTYTANVVLSVYVTGSGN